ncbi:MAG: replication factor C small subunit [Candidatus Aenigmarchaeota archaeon]|nr:replication factor C small subunit [Candidatus Aenigmarchaeota archaeon]
MAEIWTEKYRPKKLNDVVGQKSIVSKIKMLIERRSIPHCLFTGHAGIGKSTLAFVICNELFGEDWKNNFLDLNASDTRGIDTIRSRVKDFARTIPISGGFKIIFLDEADALTKDAQHALRRIMENYSDKCRFFLSCNFISRIIHPIQSRTAVFRFSPLKEQEVIDHLRMISGKENVKADDNALKAIFNVSEGDLRKAINILQMASLEESTTEAQIYDIVKKDSEQTRKMLNYALSGNFLEARNSLITMLESISGEDVIKEVHEQLFHLDMPDQQKIILLEKIGECEFRLVEGSNPRIQIGALLAHIALNAKK